jgi:Spy/CpxP family protein refolding chaperone
MTFRSGLLVFALFLTVSAIASAQRFGGSGNQATQRTAQTPPPTGSQTGQSKTAPPQNATQPQSNGRQSQSRPEQLVGWEWWKDDEVKRELKLADNIVRSIQRKYEDRARMMKPVDEAYRKEFDELNRLAKERTVDVAMYSIQVNRVEALRTELFKTRTVMLYEFYRMLTPEQYLKFQEIRDRRRAGRGGGGGPR